MTAPIGAYMHAYPAVRLPSALGRSSARSATDCKHGGVSGLLVAARAGKLTLRLGSTGAAQHSLDGRVSMTTEHMKSDGRAHEE